MWSFYKALLKNFRNVGAFAPSSRFLAKSIAESLPQPLEGLVVELGPGTGAITKGILNSGVQPQKIVAIEYSSEFAQKMRDNYPEILTIEGSAENLNALLKPLNSPVHAVVSSLPLRSLPDDAVKTILAEIEAVLMPQGYYIQFTYFKKQNPVQSLEQFYLLQSKRVLLNLPPARVDVLKKT